MKKIYILFFLIFIYTFSEAQRNAVVGISLGRAYYLGEINTSKQFYKTKFAYGAFYRYDINTRYSARANVLYTHLSADDNDFDSNYQKTRAQTMNTSILDVTLQAEFNFLPYDPTSKKKNNYTPFVAVGITYFLKDFSIGAILDNLAIPFGLGFRYNINKQIALGVEWNFRKTFRDNLDYEYSSSPAQKQVGYQHDKDWYSVAGIFLTYKFKTYTKCPAFD